MDIDSFFNETYPNVEILTTTSSYTGITTTKTIENLHTIFKISSSTGVLMAGMIPDFIKHVEIKGNYQLKIEPGILPPELIKFDMGHYYNIKLTKNWLPHNLVYLKMSNLYNHEIDKDTFPENLIYLSLPYCYDRAIIGDYFPNSIKFLNLAPNIMPTSFPINLTHLYCDHGKGYTFKNVILPPNLYLITFSYTNCYFPNNFYPKTLKVINFTNDMHGYVNDKILDNIPSSVEMLIFSSFMTILLNLPTTIKKIKIMDSRCSLEKINYYFPKIPFGCIIVDKKDSIIVG